jgi:two-component system response regulator NreC
LQNVSELQTSDLAGWQAQPVRAEETDRTKITVIIADDHTVVRPGLRLLIDHEDGFQVVAEAGTVPDAERLTRVHRPSASRARQRSSC